MVALPRIMTAALGVAVASSVIACGALIGIEDGVADPGLDATDATTIDSSTDASRPDTSTADASPPDAGRTPMGKPGGSLTSLPCGTSTCTIPAQACCAYRTTGDPTRYSGECAATCPAAGGSTDKVATIKCSASVNCPAGDRCCWSPGGSSASTSCKSSCGSGEVSLCEPGSSNQCGIRTCRRFSGDTMPQSYGYCG